ncbi:MAG: hypothetical protein M3N19_11835 [Candidatus Eremiobacteraeota bacterium]|nr:hypothetical protein [Candidatus Eremiobacteraeota bacterium]
MPALDMREAEFKRTHIAFLQPTSVTVESGATVDLVCENAVAAGIAARLAAGIIKCSAGQVFVADFDPKIQPVQVKRLVGFLPSARPNNPFCPDDYFAYRAALWGLDRSEAIAKGRNLLKTLDDLRVDEAALLAGVFLHDPVLLILERPGAGLREGTQALIDLGAQHAPRAALFVTTFGGPS